MKRYMLALICGLLFGLTVLAQDKPKGSSSNSSEDWTCKGKSCVTWTVPAGPAVATATEFVTKDGHYVWTLDDPNDRYRCEIVSKVEGRDYPEAFMVACFIKHDVEKKK